MITSSLRFWLKEATVFPINNSILAINYLNEFYGSNIILGKNFINKTISQDCQNVLLRNGHLNFSGNNYLFKG